MITDDGPPQRRCSIVRRPWSIFKGVGMKTQDQMVRQINLRPTAFVLVCMLVLGITNLCLAVTGQTGNFIDNPGAEDGVLDPWQTNNSFKVDTDSPRSGTYTTKATQRIQRQPT